MTELEKARRALRVAAVRFAEITARHGVNSEVACYEATLLYIAAHNLGVAERDEQRRRAARACQTCGWESCICL